MNCLGTACPGIDYRGLVSRCSGGSRSTEATFTSAPRSCARSCSRVARCRRQSLKKKAGGRAQIKPKDVLDYFCWM